MKARQNHKKMIGKSELNVLKRADPTFNGRIVAWVDLEGLSNISSTERELGANAAL